MRRRARILCTAVLVSGPGWDAAELPDGGSRAARLTGAVDTVERALGR